MDQYFERMAGVLDSGEMPSRIKFMIQDVIEMRLNRWKLRNVARELKPRTIGEIREGYARPQVCLRTIDYFTGTYFLSIRVS